MYAIVTDVHKEDAYYPHRDKVIGIMDGNEEMPSSFILK